MASFAVILVLVILAFGACFYLLDEFPTPSVALFGAYLAMLGEFQLDDGKFQRPLSRLLLVFFLVVALIMMLNLLIAIISDTFERVIERKAAQFTKEQALLICEMERHLLFGRVVEFFFLSDEQVQSGRLHVLRPKDTEMEHSSEQQWQGRMRRLKDHMTEQVSELKKEVKNMESKMEAMKAMNEKILVLLEAKNEGK